MVADSSIPHDEDMNDNCESNIVNSSKDRHYYSILNIPRDADSAHIQRNYKLLSRIYHPDKATATGIVSHNNNRDIAQQSFVIIKSAVDVLCDPIYRFVYDYGDEIAVTLVKRSQSARYSEQHQHGDSNKNRSESTSQNRQDDYHRHHYHHQDNEDDDLYTILQNKIRQSQDLEAMSILDEVLENYYAQQKNLSNNTHASKFDLSCSIPMSWKEADRYYYNAPPPSRLHKESISLNAQGRYPVTSHFGISLGAGSEVHHQQQSHQQQQPQQQSQQQQKQQHSNKRSNSSNNNNTSQSSKNNIKGSIGFDFQPVVMPGTSVHGNITANPNRITAPDISINTSRKCSNDSVVVAAIHGNVRNSKSWYTSFISSKPILYETIFGKSFCGRNDKKLMMNWRIICDMMGRLRGFMMSLRNMEYPMWSCRLSLSNYPLKLSWCGSETDTFYVAVSLGPLDWPRIKIVRISSFGSADRGDHQWKIKYGLKHDPQQAMLYSGSSLWSIVCTIQYANEFTLRLPIRLLQSSSTPAAWIGSILVAEFVDQQLKEHVQWNEDSMNDFDSLPALHSSSGNKYHFLPKEALDAYRKVANKKRADESNKPDGLVILQANLTFHNAVTMVDITDTLQFWVVNSQLNMSLSDVRLLWQVVDDDIAFKNEVVTLAETDWWWLRRWWNVWCHDDQRPNQTDKVTAHVSQLDIRYQYKGMTYQIAFDATAATEDETAYCDDASNRINNNNNNNNNNNKGPNAVQLPNINAIELGPSNRVR